MGAATPAGPLPHFHALILAGGRGTRFWPRSRRACSKQVLQVVGEGSLLEQTWARLRPVVPPQQVLVITNAYLREEILRQLPELPAPQIIAEPAQRNTAPAIGLAARILREQDPEAVMGVFPADHFIARPAAFRRILRQAYRAALEDRLVVLGIRPTRPETGYGYIEFAPARTNRAGAVPVRRFREKPDLATARRFLRSGRFYWNSGMFVWKAAVIEEALREHLPVTAAVLANIRGAPGEAKFTASLEASYPHCENISIDYAVLEKAPDIVGFPCGEMGWNDVGSWEAVYNLLPQDRRRNVARGEVLFHESAGNYVDAPDKVVALVGMENVIVVETEDALLIARRDRAQEVGEVVKALEKKGRVDLL